MHSSVVGYILLMRVTAESQETLPLRSSSGIAALHREFVPNLTYKVTGACVAAIPMIIVFVFLQKYFTTGSSLGAVKDDRPVTQVDSDPPCIYSWCVGNIRFTWDMRKSQVNLRKHGVSFEEARTAFYDPNARLIADPVHSDQEGRFLLLGFSRNLRLLVVCHCYRQRDEIIRIISARKATRREAEQYHNVQGE